GQVARACDIQQFAESGLAGAIAQEAFARRIGQAKVVVLDVEAGQVGRAMPAAVVLSGVVALACLCHRWNSAGERASHAIRAPVSPGWRRSDRTDRSAPPGPHPRLRTVPPPAGSATRPPA